MRTLVIDPAPARRALVAEVLRKRGYEVTTFADPGPARVAHEARPAQLVVLACDSGIDGAATCLDLRDVPGGEEAVILALAVDCRAEELIELLYAGFDDFLTPPITAESLTPRLMMAERTRAAAAKHRAIFSALPDLMLRIARDGTLLDFRANQLTGVVAAPERVVGRNLADVMPPELAAAAPRHLEQALATGKVQILDYQVSLPAGDQAFEARFVRCGDDQVLAIVRNVTEKKQAQELEAQLLRTQKLESVGVLAGAIAHDFNNLLVGMLGNAALALRALPADNPAWPRVDDIRAAAERAAGLARQILAYSGQGSLDLRKLALSDHVREISHLLASAIGGPVALELDLAAGLPALEADPAQLQQLVMNLVVNGAEAVGDRPGKVAVTTTAVDLEQPPAGWLGASELPPGRYLLLEVGDTGCGIDERTRQSMFDPFFTTKGSGRGLGLAAVLGIVRRHRAGLVVDSAVGAGTRVRVYFPAAAGPLPAPAAPRAEDLRGEGLILVVDDEKLVRDFARHALREFGYSVVAADNPLDALDLFRRLGDEVVLAVLDLALPHMPGEAALDQLRALRPELPALLITGFDAAAAATRVAPRRRVAVLQKPFTPDELAARVKALLAG